MIFGPDRSQRPGKTVIVIKGEFRFKQLGHIFNEQCPHIQIHIPKTAQKWKQLWSNRQCLCVFQRVGSETLLIEDFSLLCLRLQLQTFLGYVEEITEPRSSVLLVKWAKLRPLYKIVTIRREMRSPLTPFSFIKGQLCSMSYLSGGPGSGRMDMLIIDYSFLRHSPKTVSFMCPYSALRRSSGPPASCLWSLCLHSCSQVSGTEHEPWCPVQSIVTETLIKAILSQELSKDKGG